MDAGVKAMVNYRNSHGINAKVTDPRGGYVVMKIPMFGSKSLASAIMPSLAKSVGYVPVDKVEPTKSSLGVAEARKLKVSGTFTGVVVDATGLGLEPTFSPVIYDTNGRAIYGVKNINKDFAISQGMVC